MIIRFDANLTSHIRPMMAKANSLPKPLSGPAGRPPEWTGLQLQDCPTHSSIPPKTTPHNIVSVDRVTLTLGNARRHDGNDGDNDDVSDANYCTNEDGP